ncbi:alkene reductase [Granulosicoccus antarcticus]|uniref:N-ethylmaleimide reductase n=1 Tax=Granulosicoccus antarcticus IMCC3135 TaxID=1192854 RepID=A0A2Z2NND1_9GAMM|nr:alkene reductase [Granulosicoccus antarcticus]ASJ71441.1 N-ethylmaleimide reductase [Granulosicoccus antarcticus IMCC3135]
MSHALFSPITVGDLHLANRLVMAPLTRNRADVDGDVPHKLHETYYAQRASAGLIITEATQISPEGKGYYRTPGIYSEAQVAGWKRVTDAVHAKGGKIFAQLWHVGRVSHTSLQIDGQAPVAPSALRAEAKTFIESGFVDTSTPRALETDEIPRLIEDFAHAARQAKVAGFDGVELHAANGYLLDQFMRTSSNHRDDAYGGSVENRTRLLGEVIDALLTVWSPGCVGVRFSPFSHAGGVEIDDQMEIFLAAIAHAERAGLAYMHIVEGETGGERTATTAQLATLRSAFSGKYMGNNGYDRSMAMRAIEDRDVDLVCIGRPFISNPDLVERFEIDAPLNSLDPDTLYGGAAEGYTDYPFMSEVTA